MAETSERQKRESSKVISEQEKVQTKPLSRIVADF